ncbi:MAG TPA: hypothetical protein VM146_00560 [Steroidobacteraceae bacterium]|nr:hypothetical protein [Steroidobacteraceae bacterium]
MNSLDRKLELFSHDEPPAEAVQDAQRKLESVIAGAAPRRRKPHVGGWLAAAASAVVAVIAAIWLPLSPGTALAFSDVQKHFRDFHSLRFDIEQRANGEMIMKSRVNVRADGSVRTEVGEDIVVVVNTQEKRVLTLVKPEHIAVVTPLPEPGTKEDAMDWLKDIRDFQGMARALPEVRVIQGQRAHGWELPMPTGKGTIVLWATDEGLPLEMKIDQGVALDMSFHFEFEPRVPADYFSTQVPEGYKLGTEED